MRRLLVAGLMSALAIVVVPAAPPEAAAPAVRTVYVTVVDERGSAATNLKAENFAVKEGGKDCVIVSAEPATEKMRLALMIEEPLAAMAGIRVGIGEFVQRLHPTAEIALILIRQRGEVVVDYTSDTAALLDGISSLPLSQVLRASMVPESLYDIAKLFEKTKPARPVIVLVALEREQTSSEDPAIVLTQLARSRAQLSVVSVETGGTPSSRVGWLGDGAARSQIIGDGSRQSGGRKIQVLTLPAATAAFGQLADDLSSQYLITYTLPAGARPSDRISVTLKAPGLTLRAPSRTSNK